MRGRQDLSGELEGADVQRSKAKRTVAPAQGFAGIHRFHVVGRSEWTFQAQCGANIRRDTDDAMGLAYRCLQLLHRPGEFGGERPSRNFHTRLL